MRYVQVAVNLPVKNIFKQFTYSVPPALDFLTVGFLVVVPFGKQLLEGFIVGEALELDDTIEYKPILDTLGTEPWFDAEMLATAQQLAEYYLCSLAEAMRLFIPGKRTIQTLPRYIAKEPLTQSLTEAEQELYSLIQSRGGLLRRELEQRPGSAAALRGLVHKQAVELDYEVRHKIQPKTVTAYRLSATGQAALGELPARLKAQRAALELVSSEELTPRAQLLEQGVSAATLRTLVTKGYVESSELRVFRDSYSGRSAAKELLELTTEQEAAIAAVAESLTKQEYRTYLLQGITGSGKTEVYLRLVAQVLAEGKQAIVLVPEIALTGQIVRRFQAWFGATIAVVHSKLSVSERADVWQRFRQGAAQVLIGVRSAIFAPVQNLGLIILDEEHEYTYKQEERPNYHARQVAQWRAQAQQVPVVLGSATPSLESYYQAQQGHYTYLQLTQRPTGTSQLPQVQLVDMRAELQAGNRTVLSRALQKALIQTVEQQEQAIVLLNRRGFSTFVMCRDCGATVTCTNCAVAMVYHAKEKQMRCHYCGNTQAIPDECPQCHSRRIKFFGTGTEKAEQEIKELSPLLKPLRMDQDSTMRKFAHEEILRAFIQKEYNILLGTQMVAKGHDIPNVTMVGVLSADSMLNLPDFRAGERTFALLTQAAGRAGRGDKPGHVFFQVYAADNPIVGQAARQDYASFAKQELQVRAELFYPPYASLLKVVVHHEGETEAIALADKLVYYLSNELEAAGDEETQVLGPFPAIVPKVMHIYRINVLIKSKQLELVKQILWRSEFKQLANVTFDVDPVNVV